MLKLGSYVTGASVRYDTVIDWDTVAARTYSSCLVGKETYDHTSYVVCASSLVGFHHHSFYTFLRIFFYCLDNAHGFLRISQPKKELTSPIPKKNRGRQKIEIKVKSKRHVTFSKRRRGLFKKAAELSVLTGAKIAVLTFSMCDRIYSFGHVDSLIGKYLRNIPVNLEIYAGDDDTAKEEGKPWWERPVESVPEEYNAAMSMLRDKLGNKIIEIGNVEIVPAWPINIMGWKPQMDMQSLENTTHGITRCRLGQNTREGFI